MIGFHSHFWVGKVRVLLKTFIKAVNLTTTTEYALRILMGGLISFSHFTVHAPPQRVNVAAHQKEALPH